MDLEEKIKSIVWIIILIAIFGDFFGWSQNFIDTIIGWLKAAMISFIFSAVAGSFIEYVSGDTFKNITFNKKIGKINVSISLFFVLTILLRYFLFK